MGFDLSDISVPCWCCTAGRTCSSQVGSCGLIRNGPVGGAVLRSDWRPRGEHRPPGDLPCRVRAPGRVRGRL